MTPIYLSPPDVGDLEREYLLRAFDGGWIAPVGPDLDAFERELADLAGVPAAVALSSGTAALHLALLNAGIKPGHRVAASSFTFAATINAITYCGAVPVLIDSEPGTWNLSPALLQTALEEADASGSPIRAVVVVDLYGQCADYEQLQPVCDAWRVPLVEDAAEALGASRGGQPAGGFGASGVLSFNGNKIITTSGGGALLCQDQDQADRARYLATQARQPAAHYEHTEIGFNYRLSNLLAAIGRAQLERLPKLVQRRLEINRRYHEELGSIAGLGFMPIADPGWNGWLTCILVESQDLRDTLRGALATRHIESRPLWKPMHLQPAFSSLDAYVDGTSETLFHRGLCLPSGSSLRDSEQAQVIDAVQQSLRSG